MKWDLHDTCRIASCSLIRVAFSRIAILRFSSAKLPMNGSGPFLSILRVRAFILEGDGHSEIIRCNVGNYLTGMKQFAFAATIAGLLAVITAVPAAAGRLEEVK